MLCMSAYMYSSLSLSISCFQTAYFPQYTNIHLVTHPSIDIYILNSQAALHITSNDCWE